MKNLVERIEKVGCEVEHRYPMSKYTWLRVGGEASLLARPGSCGELKQTLGLLCEYGVPWVVLGEGSNTIVYDKGFTGVVVSTKRLKGIEIRRGGKVLAECGVILGTVLNKTIRAGLVGFEFAAGIPGTVGGGIFMNAGANGGEIKDVVDMVWIWSSGKEVALSREDIRFEYRKSNLPSGSVVTKALFRLVKGDVAQSARIVKSYMDRRNRTQPIRTSNTGSIFKNPLDVAAGRLIEELGLKGFALGGAKFSEVHANFIVNYDHASAQDVLRLIDKAKNEALLKRGIRLETEVVVIGDGDD